MAASASTDVALVTEPAVEPLMGSQSSESDVYIFETLYKGMGLAAKMEEHDDVSLLGSQIRIHRLGPSMRSSRIPRLVSWAA